MLGDPQQVLAKMRVVRVQLGERGVIPPRSIAEAGLRDRAGRSPSGGLVAGRGGQLAGRWIGAQASASFEHRRIEVEPAPVRRGRSVLEDVVKRPEAASGVVEDAVEHDSHSPPVGRVEQLSQRRVSAQERVDRQVVVGVIAVVRRRSEDRRQVEPRDAEVGKLVESFGHTQQIAALEAVRGRRRVPGFERPGPGHPSASGKAIREDLVEDGVTDPGRRVDAQPFTPPIASPPTMYRWKTRYTRETGSATRIENAESTFHGVVAAYPPTIP